MKRVCLSAMVLAQALVVRSPAAAEQSATPAESQSRSYAEALVKARDATSQLSGFSIALVLGDMSTAAAGRAPTPAAAKALTDLKDFLPYKSYSLLDTQWILGTGQLATRLRGLDTKEYVLEFMAAPGPVTARWRAGSYVGEWQVRVDRLALTDPAAAGAVGAQVALTRLTELEAKLVDLRQELGAARARGRTGTPEIDALERQVKDVSEARAEAETAARQGNRPGATMINTSFSMDIGETVVVGTSRLQGDRALIVLLTAVARPTPAK